MQVHLRVAHVLENGQGLWGPDRMSAGGGWHRACPGRSAPPSLCRHLVDVVRSGVNGVGDSVLQVSPLPMGQCPSYRHRFPRCLRSPQEHMQDL